MCIRDSFGGVREDVVDEGVHEVAQVGAGQRNEDGVEGTSTARDRSWSSARGRQYAVRPAATDARSPAAVMSSREVRRASVTTESMTRCRSCHLYTSRCV